MSLSNKGRSNRTAAAGVAVLSMAMLSTCGGGSGDSPTVTNRAPSFDAESYVFTVPEDDGVVAGGVGAVAPDGAQLVLAITKDRVLLFQLSLKKKREEVIQHLHTI